MVRYQHKEIEEILKLFEKELATLNRLSRVEKMKIRKRIANSILPALAASNSEPDIFLNIVENKLNDHRLEDGGFVGRLKPTKD
jgi:hypothetical protein